MALVAMMHATEIRLVGGGREVPCDEGDEGARTVGEDYTAKWLRPSVSGKNFIRTELQVTRQEAIKLSALWDPNGPNRDWAVASPAGSLELTIDNPGAMGYVKAGRHYRITIEEVRGPRKTDDESV